MSYILGQQNNREISLSEDERRRHIYIAGKSGTGKSTLLQNLILSDLESGRGFALLDPHGDLADTIADSVPISRTKDVLYFDPLDEEYVVGFNPLFHVPDFYQGVVAARISACFKNIFADSWGPRLEYILKNAIRLLLTNPRYTLVDLPRVLTDKPFRTSLVRKCSDHHVTAFWTDEFDRYPERQRAEAISPIQNKVGQFATDPILRGIVGSRTTLDVPHIMNNRKIVLANLSKRMGEEPSHLLGAFLTTAFAQAAEQRGAIAEEDRQDFTLYVDEFQNFATNSFASILSEARKWRLNLVLANQFLDQVPDILKQAVLGNVGTLVVFRIGSYDAPILSKELGFPESDLTNLPNFHARVKLLSNGSPTEALFVRTLLPQNKVAGRLAAVRQCTRENFAHKRP